MPDKTHYATVTLHKTTVDQIKLNLLEYLIQDYEQRGALAIWASRPSVSAFVEQCIREKWERIAAEQAAKLQSQGGVVVK